MRVTIILCSFCNNFFTRSVRQVNENKKLHHKSYCSSGCLVKDRTKRPSIICQNNKCNKIFERRKYEISQNNYCSRSCAVTVNNSKYPKNPAKVKICIICKKTFTGSNKYCSFSCKTHAQTLSKEEIICRIHDFYEENGRIPLKREFRHEVAARKKFGSWNKAVVAAGFIPNQILFSKKYIAKDDHRCDSLSEKIIDDWLFRKDILHRRNVRYPGNPTLTVDFVINEYWIEFFGLYGQHKKYDDLRNQKLNLAKRYKLKLIEIYPNHLFPNNLLHEILKIFAD